MACALEPHRSASPSDITREDGEIAAVAAGADGLMIEVHPRPEEALSDGAQSLTFKKFAELMAKLRPLAAVLGRAV